MTTDSSNDASILARFDAAATDYDAESQAQRTLGLRLINRMQIGTSPKRVLDVGCGTGRLTAALTTRFPAAHIAALDLSPAMMEIAQTRTGTAAARIDWRCMDLCDFRTAEPYDLIVSSAALHWIHPIERAYESVAAACSRGGRCLSLVMVRGTLQELHAARAAAAPKCPAGAALPEPDDVKAAATHAGLRVTYAEVMEETESYASPREVIESVRTQGLTGGPVSHGARALTRGELRALEREYAEAAAADGGVRATFRAILLDTTRG